MIIHALCVMVGVIIGFCISAILSGDKHISATESAYQEGLRRGEARATIKMSREARAASRRT